MRTQIMIGNVEETTILHVICLKGKQYFIDWISDYRCDYWCVDGFADLLKKHVSCQF
jgi:hypothetical protein